MAEIEINGGEPLASQQESKKDEVLLKRLSEIKELMEKNSHTKAQLEKEPTNVITKMYLQSTASGIINTVTTLMNPLKPQQSNEKPKRFAMTLLIEELPQK